MNAGQDDTMIAIHESALSKIGGVLITLQDETIKRMNDATEAAEARAAGAEIRAKSWHDSAMTLADQRDELARKLGQARREGNELHAENGLKLQQILDLEEILFSTRIIELNDGSPCWCIEDNHTDMCNRARNATEPFWKKEETTP